MLLRNLLFFLPLKIAEGVDAKSTSGSLFAVKRPGYDLLNYLKSGSREGIGPCTTELLFWLEASAR